MNNINSYHQYDSNLHKNATYKEHNYNSYCHEKSSDTPFPHSARVDVYRGFRDSPKATSANNGSITNDSSDFNNSIFSFLAQQVQLLKQDFNHQIGNLKNCLLTNTEGANHPELSRNQTNLTQQQDQPSPQNRQMQDAINPYLSVQSQQQDPQHLQPFQNQWHQSQLIPLQNNPTPVY